MLLVAYVNYSINNVYDDDRRRRHAIVIFFIIVNKYKTTHKRNITAYSYHNSLCTITLLRTGAFLQRQPRFGWFYKHYHDYFIMQLGQQQPEFSDRGRTSG